MITACNHIDKSENTGIDLKSDYSIYSKNVRDSFYISVQLPLEYQEQPKKKYPVVVLTDANFYSPMLAPILHQYERGGLLPPLILVSIGYKSFSLMDSLRVRDFMFPASIPSDEMEAIGGGQKFYHFITDELLPKIDSSYRVDRDRRTLLGHSFGGYLSLLALLTQVENRRNDFSGFVSASPSIWYNDYYLFKLSQVLKASALKDSVNVFLSVGDKEEPKWSVQPVKDLSKQLADPEIKKVITDVEIYSHLDHMDVGLVSFIKGLEKIYNHRN
ncbi:alpha/beta hydrolase [Sphingobacterium faecium]|uniref:alpha/beta hydrolase n=1 Tax=Sphingobacterium faecium TaxID=34087 RepID=UPI00320AE117